MSTRVAVVGAGIGGLTLAIALARAGVPVEVYERADELREVGAAVALSGNGTRELYRLGVGEALDAVSTQPTELIYRDGRTGDRIAAHPGGASYRARFGAPYWGIHRVDLQQTLAAAVDPAHLHLGRAATAVTDHGDGAEITLDDGSTVTADVVVGADGVHSVVREAVVGRGQGPVYSGTSAFRGLVRRSDLPSLPDPLAIQFWAGPHAHLLHYPMGGWARDDDTINFFAVLCGPRSWQGGNTEVPDGELLAGFAGWHPAVREMLAAVEQSPRWPLLSQPPLTRWARGRIVLIGDACHAMLPHHGQGANQSIEDAVVLADLLAATDPDTALAAYPRRRRARTRAVARSAWETGTLLHLPDDDVAGLSERDARFTGYLDANAWVHQYAASDATTTKEAA
ncbi:FAD-dependent monooxygenase [Actinomycetospora sp. TBRC 11914]|uniref:FAD-dependent monooxygenase n=1 Tax=Actinomycetospora sp. TBRC 11914 TaxID=2729387 RepID=UPI00145C4166|nr:FAD-dependent monooxygenase [Actinomycetospora sp. TBRC 11914]NMO89296.1 NAD(P)-binding protein [Actinomycetospora sp. TBRC 11914]